MASTNHIYTITKLNQSVKQLLDANFGQIWVRAEVSNFSSPISGHWYFSLKDNNSQVRCAMFKNKNRFNHQKPKNGDDVLVKVKVGLFEPRGEYQLIVEYLEHSGVGSLQRQFEQLKASLAKQGLFDAINKTPIPKEITTLGIVTSTTGAAIQDVISVVKRRNPLLKLIIYPVIVQGSEAASSIIQAINLAERREEVDALLITRGGGSFEDLNCFNDEKLAMTIFACKLPLISAVGHEIDFTISDFIADLRAPTPTAAAELITKDNQVVLSSINNNSKRLQRLMSLYLEKQHQKVDKLCLRLQTPTNQIQPFVHKIKNLQLRLKQRLVFLVNRKKQSLGKLKIKLDYLNPGLLLGQKQILIQGHHQKMKKLVNQKLQSQSAKLASFSRQLNTLSPLATLDRGYSITVNNSGKVVEEVGQIDIGDELTTTLKNGVIVSNVIKKN